MKEKVIARKERWFTYFIVRFKNRVYIRKRNNKDIWANLYEFILMESSSEKEQSSVTSAQMIKKAVGIANLKIHSISPVFKQQLTHQTIYGQFITVIISAALKNEQYDLIPEKELNNYPFPKLINSFLEDR